MTLPSKVETTEDGAEQHPTDYKTSKGWIPSKNRWSEQFKPYFWLLIADIVAIGLGFALAYLVWFETNVPFFNDISGLSSRLPKVLKR